MIKPSLLKLGIITHHCLCKRKFTTSPRRYQTASSSSNNDDPTTKNTTSKPTSGHHHQHQHHHHNQKQQQQPQQAQESNDRAEVKDLLSDILPTAEKTLPEGVNKDEFLTDIFGNLDPYINTYSIYKQLVEAGFTPAQSDQIISLLIYQLNSKLTKLSTIYAQNFELENEQYLFESAQQEIRVDITRSRDQHINELIALTNILERDFNVINDELNNDYLKLKNDAAVAINESKSENTLQSKKLFLRIQEANHKITTELNSDIKSEIESLRWYLSRWGLTTLLVSLFSALMIFYSSKKKNVKEEAKKEFAPLVIREPSEYEDDDYHTELDRESNCLTRNGYNESKCTKYIDELYMCCKSFYESEGKEASSVCCPKFNLLQLKLKQRSLGQIDAALLETKRG
ncbi:CMC4 Cx9C motif-containing protein 4 [Candida maltosa Xu316]